MRLADQTTVLMVCSEETICETESRDCQVSTVVPCFGHRLIVQGQLHAIDPHPHTGKRDLPSLIREHCTTTTGHQVAVRN